MAKSKTGEVFTWMKSAGGITVTLSIIIAIVAGLDRGPYIIVNTIVTGGMLALVAVGFALIFGVLNIPMFAHGEFFMIGSLTAYYVFTPLAEYLSTNPSTLLAAVAPLIAILGAVLAGTIGGVLCELLIFAQLRKRSRENWVMNSFLLTVGLSVVLINLHQLLFGTEFKGIVKYWGGRPLEIIGVFISRDRLLAFIISMVVVGLFWVFMKFTNTGRAIRAVSQDQTGALMVGININAILMLTMALGCMLAAIAGASLLFLYPSYPAVGMEPLYLAWFVIILVGLGNTAFALVGGFIVALLKSLTVEYIGAGWDFVVPSLLITIVLVFKPSGLFGSEVRGVLDL
jgi:branched-chain amino acid transport system permease protein